MGHHRHLLRRLAKLVLCWVLYVAATVDLEGRSEVTDDDKKYMIEVIERVIDYYTDFTRPNYILALRIANKIESEFAVVTYKEKE